MGGLIKHNSKRLRIPDKSMKRVEAFKSPGIKDLGTMDSKDLFNVDRGTANLSTAGKGSAVVDIGSREGRKLKKGSVL